MKRERTLDRAAVVAAAAELIDTHGGEQLTLARLAEQLNIRTPSLYNHVAGLDGLRRELALHGMRQLAQGLGRAAMGKAGNDAVFAVAHAYRAFAKAHPGIYNLTLRAVGPDEPELQAAGEDVVAVVVATLAGYRLHGDDAVHAVRALRSLVHGFVTLEMAGGFGLPLDLDESFQRLVCIFVAGLHASNVGAASNLRL